MDIHRYRCLIFITTIIGGASSHYEETYTGHSFILPTEEKMKRPLKMTLPEAKKWCTNYLPGSTLPRIIEDRDNMFQFIQRAASTNTLSNGQIVLVNGIQHTLGNWSWINGHDVKDIEVTQVSGDEEVKVYNYGYLGTQGEYIIHASRPTDPRNYICESANLSTCYSHMIMNHKCYRTRNVRMTWFEARHRCLTENGDLASFETLSGAALKGSLQNLLPDAREDYWIGIHRNLLHLDDKGSEIKFINLTDGHRSDINDKCLCLGVSNVLRWIECNCEDSYPFICTRRALVLETNDSFTSATTIKTTTSNQMTPPVDLPLSTHAVIVSTSIDQPSTHSVIISAPLIPITVASSTVISSIDQSAPNNTNAVIGAVVSCVIIVVIIIIVVVVIIRKHRNRPVKSIRCQTSEANTTTTTNDFPIYAPVQKPREDQSTTNCSASNAVYATIEPAANTIDESQANTMVYAELDLPPRA